MDARIILARSLVDVCLSKIGASASQGPPGSDRAGGATMYKRADYFRFHTGNSDDSETSSSSETGSSEDSSRSDTPAETAERDPKKGGESSAKGKPGGIGTPAKAEGVTEGKEKSGESPNRTREIEIDESRRGSREARDPLVVRARQFHVSGTDTGFCGVNARSLDDSERRPSNQGGAEEEEELAARGGRKGGATKEKDAAKEEEEREIDKVVVRRPP